MWELDHKGGWAPKNWCLWIVVLEKTLESPLDCKEIKESILKEINSEYLLERLMLKLKFQYFGHLVWSANSLVSGGEHLFFYTGIVLLSIFYFLFFLIFIFTLFYFIILYWFCHTLTWICHGCTWVPNPEPPSHLPPHIISLNHPCAPAPSIPNCQSMFDVAMLSKAHLTSQSRMSGSRWLITLSWLSGS